MTDSKMSTVRSDKWSPERQMQEVARRWKFYREIENRQEVSFKPLPDDVIVAVPIKCGTTWLLHICHQLRMRGAEPDFECQANVITWIELERVYKVDPATMKQPASPRILATHLQYPLVPKGGRIIYCFREQKDALVSAYYYLDSHFLLKGRVSLPNLALSVMQQVESNLNDLLLWWEHRHDDDTLVLFFDDLLEDHAGCVRWIAKFIGVECDEDTLARVVHTTTHAEMARHHKKFHSGAVSIEIARKFGDFLPPENECVGRVRKNGGKSGDGQQLPVEIQQHVDQLWLDIITPKLGFSNLQEMREAWHKEYHSVREEQA